MAKKKVRYHFVTGFIRDKRDYNENCIGAICNRIASGDTHFVADTGWNTFLSHSSDAQMALLARKILPTNADIHFYYADLPYFQYNDNPYALKDTFIEKIFIMPENITPNKIQETINIARSRLKNMHRLMSFIYSGIDCGDYRRNLYGVSMLSSFLYHLFLAENGIHKTDTEKISFEERDIISLLSKSASRKELKKIGIYLNGKESELSRLRYALEYSSHPFAVFRAMSRENAHISISTEPSEGAFHIDFYRYIAWPTAFFCKKFLQSGDPSDYEHKVITLGGLEHNLPMLYWISENRKKASESSQIPEGDQANLFDFMLHTVTELIETQTQTNIEGNLLGDSEGFITALNGLLRKRGTHYCLISRIPWHMMLFR